MKKSKYPFVEVEWLDAIANVKFVVGEQDFKHLDLSVMHTVGYLAFSNKIKTILLNTMSDEHSGTEGNQYLVIPTNCIKKIRKLKVLK